MVVVWRSSSRLRWLARQLWRFQFMLRWIKARNAGRYWTDVVYHIAVPAAKQRLTGCRPGFSVNDPADSGSPSYREKAKALSVPLSQITTTLSVFMGSEYINDFDYNNRT